MALGTYAELASAIAAWLNRSDLTAQIPSFIALAEAEFNRKLRVMDMETRATAAAVDTPITLPDDCLGIKEVSLDGLKLNYLADILAEDQNASGPTRSYSVLDDAIYLYPAPSSGEVAITYYRQIPALTETNSSNWLLTRAPDLYLFACLMQAEFFGWNDERLGLIKSRVDEIIAQLQVDGIKRKHGAQPLAPLPRKPSTISRHIRA